MTNVHPILTIINIQPRSYRKCVFGNILEVFVFLLTELEHLFTFFTQPAMFSYRSFVSVSCFAYDCEIGSIHWLNNFLSNETKFSEVFNRQTFFQSFIFEKNDKSIAESVKSH